MNCLASDNGKRERMTEMNNQVKQRLYTTLVAISLLWLLVMGVVNLVQVNEIRSAALSACINDNFNIFDLCYSKTENEIYPTFLNYINPFIPVTVLLWVSWVFNINFQIDFQTESNKVRMFLLGLVYIVAFLGFILPFYIVLERDLESIYKIMLYNLFLMPWLAITWISIPIFFQKLLDSEKRIREFSNLHRVVYIVAASPILSIITMFAREQLKI